MKKKISLLAIMMINLWCCVSFSQPKVTIQNSSTVYLARYAITYTSYGSTLSTGAINVGGGQTDSKTLPSGSTNIKIKLEYYGWSWTDLKTIDAGRSGGTATLNGSALNASASWAPDDN